MYLLLERPGAPTQRIQIDGDVAVVGRAPHCDVVIDEEFVSKQHLRVFHGVVAVDMSTNGTFVDGERVVGGVLLESRPLQIGRSDITISVEVDEDDIAAPERDSQPAVAPGDDKATALLRRELESLTSELKAKATLTVQLAAEVEQARAQAVAADGENAMLRARVAELEQDVPEPPADASAASLLLFKVQRENAELKRKVTELKVAQVAAQTAAAVKAAASQAAAAPPAVAAAGPSANIVPPARDAVPAAAAASAPAAADSAASPDVVLSRLSELVSQDAEAMPVRLEDRLDAFLAVEGYRFLRRVERVTTRLAGGLIQLYQPHTMVPGVPGNLRELLSAAIAKPQNGSIRDELLDYLKELGRWMVVALSAYRKAAEGFAVQLRDELSAEALTADDPIPVMKRVSGKSEAELWLRVCARLRDLTPDLISERLEKLARDSADELADKDASQAFP